MTVSTTTARQLHAGNDSATVFSFDFPITAPEDLVVTRSAPDGSESRLQLDLDYAVSVAAYPGSGSVTCPLAGQPLAAGERLTLQRSLVVDQQIDLQNQGNFYAETHEGFFDRIVMICQQLSDAVGRAAKLPVSSPLEELVFPAPAPNRALLWNAAGDGLANGPEAERIAGAQADALAAGAAAIEAAGARDAALAARDAAEAARAALSLPPLGPGDAGSLLRVRADETGHELRAPAQVLDDIGALGRGRHSILVPAAALQPSPQQGCGPLADDGPGPEVPAQWFLPFDAAGAQHAQLTLPTPKSWDAGAFEVALLHAPGDGSGGAVRWRLRERVAGAGETAAAWGAEAALTAALPTSLGAVQRTPRLTLVPAGSPAPEDLLQLQVARLGDDPDDSHAGAARLLGLIVTFTLAQGTDA